MVAKDKMGSGIGVREIDCILSAAPRKAEVRMIHGVRSADPAQLAEKVGHQAASFAATMQFTARPGQVVIVPGQDGAVTALLGLPAEKITDPVVFGGLAARLPEGYWRLDLPEDVERGVAVLGFALGSYRYSLKRGAPSPRAVLVEPGADTQAIETARSIWLGRDLINMPANLLGPAELAAAAVATLEPFGAKVKIVQGKALARDYPLVAHVGAGSERAPCVVVASWQGSGVRGPDAKGKDTAGTGSGAKATDAPLLSLVGKGVCFDTGGNDIKPAAGMLRMKKDMGGAATTLALARLVMAMDLPVRLELRLGCVENSVSGAAMRPLDVVRARNGLTVEIGNTDAEGRLVMADLLTEASERKPDLLLDVATLTGAARVALGPDLPALMGHDDAAAETLLKTGIAVSDPLWRLPLWGGYRDWLKSPVADINNISSKPFAGAITAGLFLERFVEPDVRWFHIDSYAWNDQTSPAQPEGGEIMGLRAIFASLPALLNLNGILHS